MPHRTKYDQKASRCSLRGSPLPHSNCTTIQAEKWCRNESKKGGNCDIITTSLLLPSERYPDMRGSINVSLLLWGKKNQKCFSSWYSILHETSWRRRGNIKGMLLLQWNPREEFYSSFFFKATRFTLSLFHSICQSKEEKPSTASGEVSPRESSHLLCLHCWFCSELSGDLYKHNFTFDSNSAPQKFPEKLPCSVRFLIFPIGCAAFQLSANFINTHTNSPK